MCLAAESDLKSIEGFPGCTYVSTVHFGRFLAKFERFLLYYLCKFQSNLKYSKMVLLVEVHIVCKDHQQWTVLLTKSEKKLNIRLALTVSTP